MSYDPEKTPTFLEQKMDNFSTHQAIVLAEKKQENRGSKHTHTFSGAAD